MKPSILGIQVDERFLTHRQRSTGIAGLAAVSLALGLFAYRYYHDHLWSWDLLAVGVTMVVVKLGLLVYYRLTD
jgi:high-affinity Fe2+/Pb2+ permease